MATRTPLPSPALDTRELATEQATRSAVAAQSRSLGAIDSVLASDQPVTDKARALRTIIEGADAEDRAVIRQALFELPRQPEPRTNPDEALAADWREGAYPYANLLRRSAYEKDKFRLQVELLKLQAWVKENRQRVLILFEGRDAAGKGGPLLVGRAHTVYEKGERVTPL